MRRRRNAKIIATLGPGTSNEKSISDLFLAGVDVFRLNFSHGAHAEHKLRFDIIRAMEKKYNRPIGILLDLQGPKLRLGEFEGGKADLHAGNPFRLELAKIKGNDVGASLPHPEIFAALKPEMKLLLDDGKVELRVHKCGKDYAETMVITGGELSDRKGVNVPSAMLDLSPITEKDHKDLEYGLELGVDWGAVIRSAAGGYYRGEKPGQWPCRGDGETGKTLGHRLSRRNRRTGRCGDGGAW